MADLAEDPGPALCRATDHDGVGAGELEHALRLFGRRDIAIGDDRNADCSLDRADRVVLDGADVRTGASAAVHRNGADTRTLRDPRNGKRIPVVRVGARADLERHRHVDGAHHRVHDRRDQRLVSEQCRARGGIADLLRRATHVDVDDLRAAIDVVARGIGHQRRIGAGDLHGDGLDLAGVIGAPP